MSFVQKSSRIFASRCSLEDMPNSIKNGFESTGYTSIDKNARVVIKPNLCCIKSPETGATTDVKVVESIIRYLKSEFQVSDILIVESDATQVLADMAFRLLGYERLSKRYDVSLVNLSKCPCTTQYFPKNALLKEVQVPNVFREADVFITVPKIKTHMDCYFTCALKNQYGCNPYPRKSKYHSRLTDAIVDLNAVFKPDFVVVDGLVALEGQRGPTDGLPIKMNTLIFGTDPVAVDCFVAKTMGLEPKNIDYLMEAEKRGIGNTKYESVGLNIENIERKFLVNKACLRNFYGLFRKY
jgi:uncharacterized protein (DUF362 family)